MEEINLIEILIGILTVIVGIVGIQLKRHLTKVYDNLKVSSSSSSISSLKDSTLCHKFIQDRISDLRHEFSADRSYVFQFHNGSYFNTRQPIWKVSCTNESCAQGVDYEAMKLVDYPCNFIIDSLYPFFGGSVKGASRLDGDGDPAKGVYYFDIDQMKDGMTKCLFENQGKKTVILSPLISPMDSRIVGFVGLDFLEYTPKPENFELIRKLSTNIAYSIEKTFLAKKKEKNNV